MRVLLLGATGLLGNNVLRRLADSGHEVVALVRDIRRLEAGRWSVEEGSLLDYGTLLSAAAGCEAVVNCAGTTDMSLLRLDDYRPVNSQLPGLLARMVGEHVVQRVVHVSSVDTVGYGSAEAPSDESAPMRSPFTESLYAQSKREGEQALLHAAAANPSAHVVVVNPGFMIGPYDAKPSSGRMLLYAYKRRLALAPGGGKAFVDARDVAQAVVAALERGSNGSRYVAVNNGGCLSFRQLFELQARVMGYRQHVVVVPDWLLLAAAKAGDAVRALGVRTELSTNNVRQLLVSECYDCSRGLAELGFGQTPVGEAIAEFHKWRNEKHRQI